MSGIVLNIQQKEALKKLNILLYLIEHPDFSNKDIFAELADLAVLSNIEGLESLSKLKQLENLKNTRREPMGNLFGQYAPVRPEVREEKLEALIAYEEHYMRLLSNYKNEIEEIEHMMERLRKEREDFYYNKLPAIEQAINNDQVLSAEAKEKWISELRTNVEKSFSISETLISHYVTSNLADFKIKMQEELRKV